jgi:hypothetical protein
MGRMFMSDNVGEAKIHFELHRHLQDVIADITDISANKK